jgi:DNA excision repair protein ERCC-2
LTYNHLDTDEIREIRKSFDSTELELFFFEVVDRFIEWAARMDEWRRIRDQSLRDLSFPFASYRPGQRSMAVEVYRTVKAGHQLIVQAPTGIGKTVAVLFPALKAMAEEHTERFVYLTARTTGKGVAEKTLEALRESGMRAKSVTLTAKDKICFNPEKACNGEECEFARRFYDRIGDACLELFERDHFGREALEDVARRHRVCPFELSLELALWADGIIGDYNYAFDPTVSLKRFLEDESTRTVFMVDEAHNLVDRAREMYSAEIDKASFLELRRHTRNVPDIYKSLGKINSHLVKKRKQCESAGGVVAEDEPPEKLYPLLRRFLRSTEQWLSTQGRLPEPLRDVLLDVYFDAHRFLRTAERYDETYSTCYERTGSNLKLKLFCKDPSTQLGEALARSESALFFSATLTPARYFQNIFGCGSSVRYLSLPSPFPPEHLSLVISDKISTLYRRREQTKEAVAATLIELVEHRRGNYLLYFPSYEYMMSVHELFSARRPHTDILVQAPSMTEPGRDAFLRRFEKENEQTLVGFAVMGGVFGEGIDLAGNRLTGAAVVGVGLPAICQERELIRDYYQRRGSGFEFAYLYPGINRVLQAAGRVIRSENDRGTVLLIDERFSRPVYRSLLPSYWQPVRVGDQDKLREALAAFWEKQIHRPV